MALLSARVGSISDNRSGGWHGYRAAKAGLNMMIVNFAHEMRFRNTAAVILGLHPGTVETRLSAPSETWPDMTSLPRRKQHSICWR